MAKNPHDPAIKNRAALVRDFVQIESNTQQAMKEMEAEQEGGSQEFLTQTAHAIAEQYQARDIDYMKLLEFHVASHVACLDNRITEMQHEENVQKIYRAERADANIKDKPVLQQAVWFVKAFELGIPMMHEKKAKKQKHSVPQSSEARREKKIRDVRQMDLPELVNEYSLAKDKFEKRHAEGRVNTFNIERFHTVTNHIATRTDDEGKPLISWTQHLEDLNLIVDGDTTQLSGKEAEDARIYQNCIGDELSVLLSARQMQQQKKNVELAPQIKLVKPLLDHRSKARIEHIAPIVPGIYYEYHQKHITAQTAKEALDTFRYELTFVLDDLARNTGKRQLLNEYKAFDDKLTEIVYPEKAAMRALYLPAPKNQ